MSQAAVPCRGLAENWRPPAVVWVFCAGKRWEAHRLQSLHLLNRKKGRLQDTMLPRNLHLCNILLIHFLDDLDKKNRHRQFHYGQRKYKCDVYGAVLKGKGNFNRHLLIHSGQKKYRCDMLGKEPFTKWAKETTRQNIRIYGPCRVGRSAPQLEYPTGVQRKLKANVDSLELTATELLSIDLLTLGSAESLARGRGQSFPTRRSFRWDIGFGGGVGTVVPETELTPSTLDLPSQVTDVSLPCKYLNLEKCLIHKEEKRNCKLMGQKETIFLNDSALGENSTRSCQEIIEKKHVNLFKKFCDFKDSTTEHNNTKQNLISTLQRKYMCNVCNKDFKEKGSLNKHLLVHSKQRKYKCEVCNKIFKWTSHLKRHLLIHSEQRNYKCDVCNKSFKLKGSLNSHLLGHSEQRNYKCNVCDKSFKRKNTLNSHLLIHSEQRKYKCDICYKSFNVKSILNFHLLGHSEQRNYKCDVCNKSFKRTSDLNSHLRIHSNKESITQKGGEALLAPLRPLALILFHSKSVIWHEVVEHLQLFSVVYILRMIAPKWKDERDFKRRRDGTIFCIELDQFVYLDLENLDAKKTSLLLPVVQIFSNALRDGSEGAIIKWLKDRHVTTPSHSDWLLNFPPTFTLALSPPLGPRGEGRVWQSDKYVLGPRIEPRTPSTDVLHLTTRLPEESKAYVSYWTATHLLGREEKKEEEINIPPLLCACALLVYYWAVCKNDARVRSVSSLPLD
uniref:C2H2-type domain-containing protein n=1 Tax=Timema genevievae TaxID=629358 RepID=A0A7R9PP47_TIMGE|nr:unnamed protein product [Timema genevievae]